VLYECSDETTKGEETGVIDPGGVAVVQKAYKDDEDQQGFNRSPFQPCSKEDAAADARLRELEQELHILEEELKNESQLLGEEDEKLYADAFHTTMGEVTARASGSGAYRASLAAMVSTKGIPVPRVPYTHTTFCLSLTMLALLKTRTRTEVPAKGVSFMNIARQSTPLIKWGTQTPVKPPRLSFRSMVK
jgi:hypothetical protein